MVLHLYITQSVYDEVLHCLYLDDFAIDHIKTATWSWGIFFVDIEMHSDVMLNMMPYDLPRTYYEETNLKNWVRYSLFIFP